MGQLMTLAPPAADDPNAAAMQASVQQMADAYAKIFDHFGMTILANDRGIEMRQEMTLK